MRLDNIWSKEDLNSLSVDYPNRDMAPIDFEKKYNRTWKAISSKAKILKIKRRKVSLLTYEDVKKLYIDGMTMEGIGKICKIDKSSVGKILKNKNVEIRLATETARKYTLNENYFDKIDTQDKCYWLGWIYSDGCISGNTITIALQEDDKEILEKLRDLIGSNRPLVFQNGRIKNDGSGYRKNQYSLVISSKYLVNRLLELGCTSKKAHTIQFPQYIPKELIKFWILAYFDGDGSVNKSYKNSQCSFSICGNKFIVPEIQKILVNELNLCETKLYYKKESNCALTYSGKNQIIKIMEWLYQDATIYLQRKYDKYQEIKNMTPKKRDVLGLGVKSGRQAIDISTGKVYKSGLALCMDLDLKYAFVKRQLCGSKINNTPYMYLDQFIKLNPQHPIALQHTTTQLKQTA